MKTRYDKDINLGIELVEGKGTKLHGGRKGGHYWHVYNNDQRAGRVYINQNESKSGKEYASITVELNKDNRGMGIGTFCFGRACELSSYDKVYAEMRKGNIASQKAAARAGFEHVKGYKGSQVLMIWDRNKDGTV